MKNDSCIVWPISKWLDRNVKNGRSYRGGVGVEERLLRAAGVPAAGGCCAPRGPVAGDNQFRAKVARADAPSSPWRPVRGRQRNYNTTSIAAAPDVETARSYTVPLIFETPPPALTTATTTTAAAAAAATPRTVIYHSRTHIYIYAHAILSVLSKFEYYYTVIILVYALDPK